jgi:hypothetical protein
MRSLLLLVALLLIDIPPVHATGTAARICYDRQCMTIDGKDFFIFSGAFHYTRCPQPLWRDRFARMKEAGLNTVETYVPWNYHEQDMPSGLSDMSTFVHMDELAAWLRMAIEEYGFYVILRPGPYICAEWDGGGFPQWLALKKPQSFAGKTWLRGDDPAFVQWSERWLRAVAGVAKPFLLTQRPIGAPGIIFWQIENEYDYAQQPWAVKRHHLGQLARIARACGVDVPLITCQTKGTDYRSDTFVRDNVIETSNFYPGYNMSEVRSGFARLATYQPDKPMMVTELQGGWFTQVSMKSFDEFSAAQITQITVQAIEAGATGLNYYMFFGGTNFGTWAAKNVTTTYDYGAPIRENGGVGERFYAVRAIGALLKQYGPRLARTERVPLQSSDATHADVFVTARRDREGNTYFFVRSEDRNIGREGSVSVRESEPSGITGKIAYRLEPFGAGVYIVPAGDKDAAHGTWFEASFPVKPKHPKTVPPAMPVTAIARRADSPLKWESMPMGRTLTERGIFDRRYVMYRSSFTLTRKELTASRERSLAIVLASPDAVVLRLNDSLVFPRTPMVHAPAFMVPVSHLVREGKNTIELLFENEGRANGGINMEELKGIVRLDLLNSGELSRPLPEWKMLITDSAATGGGIAPGVDDSRWKSVSVETEQPEFSGYGKWAVYRSGATMSAEDIAGGLTMLTFGRIDDEGWVYVNGQKAGEAHDWDRIQVFNVEQFLKPGKNAIAVVVSNSGGNEGGIAGGVRFERNVAASKGTVAFPSWEIASNTMGTAGNWQTLNLDEQEWEKSTPPMPSSQVPGLLTWYRMTFAVPAVEPDVWVPWYIEIEATGNGLLYLNGHPLGRYWQNGLQRRYFLPDCWLTSGPGAKNVVAVQMRATERGALLKSVTLVPDKRFSEQR